MSRIKLLVLGIARKIGDFIGVDTDKVLVRGKKLDNGQWTYGLPTYDYDGN